MSKIKYYIGQSPLLVRLAPPVIATVTLGSIWEAWIQLAEIPVYILPSPLTVLERLITDFSRFAASGGLTLLGAIAGFLLGSCIALVAASLMAQSKIVERSLYPIALLVKVTPMVAIAPLFVIWFGFNIFPIVLVAAVITFFPVMVNAYIGLRSVNKGALDFFRSVDASPYEIFINLQVPSSLPYLFAGFRTAVPLSVIGAFVGEFFSGNRGLGGLMFVAYHDLDMPTLFAAIFLLALIGISLTIVTSSIEQRMLFWQESFVKE